MTAFDAVIIGAGPAGLTYAGALRRAGLDVIVLHRLAFPRHNVCAGWITPLGGFAVAYGRRPAIDVRYNRVVAGGIRRGEFDDHLLRKAQVPAMLGTPRAPFAESKAIG